jgi:formylglycine-generating enzyme required for sulfatase activity
MIGLFHALLLALMGTEVAHVGAGESAGQEGGSPRGPAGELTWVTVPPGVFQMGCVSQDTSCGANERPRHEVVISRGFAMTATPITVGQYRVYVESAPSKMPRQPEWSGERHPVVETTWTEAQNFCTWAGGRLPTEAEWEYAARAGRDGMLYPWGDDFGKGRVNVGGYDGTEGTQTIEVATFAANAFGLFDVVGNVWQWVSDWYDEQYFQSSPSADPPGPPDGRFRVARGASWKPYPKLLRISNRGRFAPEHHNYYLGLRCVREVQGRQKE